MNNNCRPVKGQAENRINRSNAATYGRSGVASSISDTFSNDVLRCENVTEQFYIHSSPCSFDAARAGLHYSVICYNCRQLIQETTPVSNTGVAISRGKPTSDLYSSEDFNSYGLVASVSWITASFQIPENADDIAFLRAIADSYINWARDDDFVKGGKTSFNYSCSLRSFDGVVLGFDYGRKDCALSIPQSVLEQYDISDIVKLLHILKGLNGCKFTRLDFAFDDYEKRISPEHLQAATKTEEYCSRLKKFRSYSGRQNRQTITETFYIGAVQSNFRVRFYRKDIESKGKLDCYRAELQLRDDLANGITRYLLQEEKENWPRLVLEFLTSRIDFRDPDSNKNITRRKRSQWWADFCNTAQRFRFSVQAPIRTIQRLTNWVYSSVAPGLATIQKHAPDLFESFIADVLADGSGRLKRAHKFMIARAQKQLDEWRDNPLDSSSEHYNLQQYYQQNYQV